MVGLPEDDKSSRMFIRFDTIHERDGRTDGHRTTERTALAINRAAKIDRSTVTLRDALPK